MKSLSMRNRCVIGFTLFSMFFGAGNLIFPPLLGAEAGSSTIPAMGGWNVTDGGGITCSCGDICGKA